MESTLKSIYNDTLNKYKLELIAGSKGLDTIISWVHLIEDITTTDFIRGNELIITTGLRYKGEQWLKTFIEDLMTCNAKGLIINTGNYIQKVPYEIIKLCDRMNFPLFTMPWEVHLVDIMQDYCNRILQADRILSDESNILIKALVHPDNKEDYEPYLEEHGFNLAEDYGLLLIEPANPKNPNETKHLLKQMQINISNMLHRYHMKFNILTYRQQLILLFPSSPFEALSKNAERISSNLKRYHKELKASIVVGPIASGISNLHKSYYRSQRTMALYPFDKNNISYYDQLGIEKILIEVTDDTLLQELRGQALKALMDYDLEHNTDYIDILRLYIVNNCSINAVAEASYTHRNTVSYRINKIKAILPYSLDTVENRFKYQMAFYIHDMLSNDS